MADEAKVREVCEQFKPDDSDYVVIDLPASELETGQCFAEESEPDLDYPLELEPQTEEQARKYDWIDLIPDIDHSLARQMERCGWLDEAVRIVKRARADSSEDDLCCVDEDAED